MFALSAMVASGGSTTVQVCHQNSQHFHLCPLVPLSYGSSRKSQVLIPHPTVPCGSPWKLPRTPVVLPYPTVLARPPHCPSLGSPKDFYGSYPLFHPYRCPMWQSLGLPRTPMVPPDPIVLSIPLSHVTVLGNS